MSQPAQDTDRARRLRGRVRRLRLYRFALLAVLSLMLVDISLAMFSSESGDTVSAEIAMSVAPIATLPTDPPSTGADEVAAEAPTPLAEQPPEQEPAIELHPAPPADEPPPAEVADVVSEVLSAPVEPAVPMPSVPRVVLPQQLVDRVTGLGVAAGDAARMAARRVASMQRRTNDAVQPQATPEPQAPAALVLRNAQRSTGRIQYLVDGQLYALEPQKMQRFEGIEPRRIQFHRGGSFGNAEQVLTAGTYRFLATPQGWELTAE